MDMSIVLKVLGALGGRSFLVTLWGLIGTPILVNYLHMTPELAAELGPWLIGLALTYVVAQKGADAVTHSGTSAEIMRAALEGRFLKKARGE